MERLNHSNPLTSASCNPLNIEEYEKITIKKIQQLITPTYPQDNSLIKDPFEEAINLAKTLTAVKKENALVWIIGHFPATNSDRAHQTLPLIETEKNRKRALLNIQITEFKTHLKQNEFPQAKAMLPKLPFDELYYYWLYVVDSLKSNDLKIDFLDDTFNLLKDIPESFHKLPKMSDMLKKVCDKYLLFGLLEKALTTARLIIHNQEIREVQLRKVGDAYLKLKNYEIIYELINEIKSSFEIQWLKQGLLESYLENGEVSKALPLIKEFDDELIWLDVRMILESFIEKLKNNGEQLLAAKIQSALETQEKLFS